MLKPQVKVLSEDLVTQIIYEGIELLADPGVQIHNSEGLKLLAEHGCRVDFEQQLAQLPEMLIRQALDTAPKEFDLYDLDGNRVIHYGGDQVHFDPGSAAVTILDRNSGSQRPPTTLDFVQLVKLVESLPQIDAQSTALIPRDVPQGMGDLYRLYLALNYMRKPIITGAFGKDTWWTMWEMLVTISGGEHELAARPIAVFDVCPTPPLLWSDLTCQNLMDCARKGVPAELISMPLAGATAPVTLTAAIVQHAAESLSGLVIHQLAGPGAPIVWGGAPAAFNMREGTTPMGDVNTWLIDLGYIQVGKALGLPTHTYMGTTDAKILDAQSGLESAGGVFLAALSGVNMVSGAGMLDFLRCQSLEKLVIDAEMIGMAKRLISGIEVRDAPIATELLRKSAHKANFLSQTHTHHWFRKEFYLPSELIDRGSVDAWQQNGSKTTAERAATRVDKLLAAYQLPPLQSKLKAELHKIAITAARRYSLEKLPPLPEE